MTRRRRVSGVAAKAVAPRARWPLIERIPPAEAGGCGNAAADAARNTLLCLRNAVPRKWEELTWIGENCSSLRAPPLGVRLHYRSFPARDPLHRERKDYGECGTLPLPKHASCHCRMC